MTLKSKAISGVMWVSLSKLMLKFITFGITIILARLLSPTDFGLVALALVFVNFFEITRDLGMESALIHYEGDDKDKNIAYNTAFIIYPVVAILLYFISYSTAPFAATFFGNEEIEPIIRVLLLTVVIWSFGTLPKTLLVKDLRFKKMFFPQILPKLSYGVVAVIMAYSGYGVWSLVIGRIVLELTGVLAYWKSIEWRPSFLFSKQKALVLISFGKYVAIAAITMFFLSNIAIALIGKILDAEALGYYSISLSIAGMFTIQASLILSQVVFPMYSKMQNDIGQLGKSHLLTIKLYSMFVLPATFGIIIISREFIETIYGAKWLPAVQVLQILCIYGMVTSYNKMNSNVFLATGKPEIVTKTNYLQLFVLLLLIYPLTINYGIYGASIAVTVSVILSTLFSFMQSNKILNTSMYGLLSSTLAPLKGSFIMLIVILLIQKWLVNSSTEVMLFVTVIAGFLVYALYFIVIYRNNLKDIGMLKRNIRCYFN